MFDKAMELDSKIALDLQSSLQKGDLKKLITQKRDLLYYQGWKWIQLFSKKKKRSTHIKIQVWKKKTMVECYYCHKRKIAI